MLSPTFALIPGTQFEIGGVLKPILDGLIEQWLLVAPKANPAMLEMFRDRDSPPLREMVPWAGEFAGKYLTSAVQVLRLTGDERLRSWLDEFVARLLRFQDEDGYLGPWPREFRLTNTKPGGKDAWDTWGHYHIMLGLILWHETSGDERALEGAARIADMICAKYLGARMPRLVDTPSTEMNLAPAHALCMLYRKTHKRPYLDMALQVVDEFAAQGPQGPLAGDYLRQALAGAEFFEIPKPRWESLHPIMALAELYWITGQEDYRRAFEHLWWSMVKLERHNNGGFTSGEQATGNPYDLRPIETCCTIAWIAISVEMLKLTGNSIVADEIELSTLNAVLGMHSPTGRWATYNTPMNGIRRASAHSIVFQAREGSPELNCCSVNSPRGFGMISDWALMRDQGGGLVVNGYGPSVMAVTLADGSSVTLSQETDYPLSGRITLHVDPSRGTDADRLHPLALKLRIPYWSRRTGASLNGSSLPNVEPGTYLIIERRWQAGDTIRLDLDMSLHFWRGERECEGLTSIYRGPILLAYDHRHNLERAAGSRDEVRGYDEWSAQIDYGLNVPVLDARHMEERSIAWEDWLPPLLLLEYDATDGRPVRLCDFASAGVAGTPYVSWLPVQDAAQGVPFDPTGPLRSAHI
jgi:DUF1680 family protein